MPLVRIRDETHQALADLAHEMDRPMGEVLAAAVERLRRDRILAETDRAYAASRAAKDRDAALWDRTTADGLTD